MLSDWIGSPNWARQQTWFEESLTQRLLDSCEYAAMRALPLATPIAYPRRCSRTPPLLTALPARCSLRSHGYERAYTKFMWRRSTYFVSLLSRTATNFIRPRVPSAAAERPRGRRCPTYSSMARASLAAPRGRTSRATRARRALQTPTARTGSSSCPRRRIPPWPVTRASGGTGHTWRTRAVFAKRSRGSSRENV